MKRALVVAHVASMIDLFNIPNIRLMIEMGYKVDVATNFIEGYTCSDEKVAALKKTLSEMGVDCCQIDFARNILKVGRNLHAYSQLRELIVENKYDMIHSHTPIGGFLSRLAARDQRKKGLKMIYTAHGFHFYKGAPLLNWVLFYPIEKLCSNWTDVLVTITHEDYALAQERMNAKDVIYVPGVGIDTDAYKPDETVPDLRKTKRKELGLKDDDILLLSVGELNKNKNHEIVIRALAKLANKNVHYVIAGRGAMKEPLETLANEQGVGEQLHLLGFRMDVRDWFKVADMFAHPSFREGLSVAVMEAMASALPIICTEIRGNTDLIDEGKGGYLFQPDDVESAYIALKKMLGGKDLKSLGAYNMEKAKMLDVKSVMDKMRTIYA